MPKTHYPYWCRLNQVDLYLIWQTYDPGNDSDYDGILSDESGHLVTFQNLSDLQAYAGVHDLAISANVNDAPLDFDLVECWVNTARKTTVDCETFLNAWNLFSDLASTIQERQAHIDDKKEPKIYDKLFYGNNLPSLPLVGEHYELIWTKSEVGRLRNVLSRGLRLLRDRLPQGE